MSENVELKRIINSVQDYVERNKYAYIVPEHLLIALMDDFKCRRMVRELTSDSDREHAADRIKSDVEDYVLSNVGKLSERNGVSPTLSYTQVIQIAVAKAAMRGSDPNSLNILLALFSDSEQSSAFFLGQHGITEDNVFEYICRNRGSLSSDGDSALAKYSTDLVSLAGEGRIDPLIGREREIERIIQVLSKKKSSNPILVGREGTGKSAVVEGLAMKIFLGEVPDSMKSMRLLSLDLTAMVAGTKFRGEFESRMQSVIKEASSLSDVVIFIDEIHNICGAGGSTDGSMDASNILKPYLSRGELHVIGATTYDEYKKVIEKDKAFARRFKKIDIVEPSREETSLIMKGLRKHYEDFHGVGFPDDVIDYIVSLSGQYLFDKCFPDKAIDVMDEIGARYRSGLSKGWEVTRKDVEDVICKMANIPEITVESSEKDRLRTLASRIKENLFGNDEIVDTVVRKICMAKAGIANKGKPVFTGLLCGPTACGKTEFAKQLAANLGVKLVRLNMSEYSEEYSTSKLIGSAAGYVGYEQSGALTEPLIQNPNAVVLLDEIEKANESVYNLLLQVLDEGQLTDNHGREASFRNAVVLMTSNVGVADSEKVNAPVGFVEMEGNTREDRKREVLEDGLKDCFSPEFRSRLTNIFYFNPIDDRTLLQIVDKNVRRLNEALSDKGVSVSLTDAAKGHFVDEARAENAGGRPVERIINSEVSERIADEILFGSLDNGGNVGVDFVEGDLRLNFSLIK